MNLREARFKKNLTQWDIVLPSGIPQSKFSLIERGYVTPSDEEKRLIAKALKVKRSEINWPPERKKRQ